MGNRSHSCKVDAVRVQHPLSFHIKVALSIQAGLLLFTHEDLLDARNALQLDLHTAKEGPSRSDTVMQPCSRLQTA